VLGNGIKIKFNYMKIGIIGQGFVGGAVYQGMKNYFETYTFDINGNCTESSLFNLLEKVNMTFLCLPTPMKKTGECDLSIVENCLSQVDMIIKSLNKKDFIVIIKSTIPPGTTERLNKQNSNINIVFNPEFLTEANAIEDYKNQNRIIIGGDRPYTSKVKVVFEKAFPQTPIVKTSSTIAEMIKYVTNTFLATKVSFANEMFQICQGLDIDYDKVIEYARYDDRLGKSHWSVPGPDGDFGYGGHCFPKDVAALQYVASEMNISTTILSATIEKNKEVRTDKDWEKQIGRAVSEE
jgi:nucleotide sugar dehydrogenase